MTPAQVQAHYANGAAVPLDTSVITEQVWQVRKKITNVTDEFRIAEDFGNGNTLTLGVYVAHYTDNDAWSLDSNVLMNNVPNASPIILQGVAGGNIYNVTSPQGIVNANGGYQILEQGKATNIAAYLSDSWKIDQLVVGCLGSRRTYRPGPADDQSVAETAGVAVRFVGQRGRIAERHVLPRRMNTTPCRRSRWARTTSSRTR